MIYREGDIVDVKKCQEILEKAESQKTEKEKDYIKDVLKSSDLFKQLQEEINFQLQENEREINVLDNEQNKINNNFLDIDVLLNRSQRNIKYQRIKKNQFLFHKGEPGHAGVFGERDKQIVNDEITKEKTLTKQIQVIQNKILHYESQLQQKEKKLQEQIALQSQLQSQKQDKSDDYNYENEIEIKNIRQIQRQKDESTIAQIYQTLNELNQELLSFERELKLIINEEQIIIKNACDDNKELIGKYFSSQSINQNICLYQKIKTLNKFNHLGEASIITNQSRTATVMSCGRVDNTENSSNAKNNQDFQTFEIKEDEDGDDNDLHLLYMEANVFVSLFSATLDQINFPLTILSKILNQTSKDLIVKISYLFKLNQYQFNSHIFTEGVDYADCIYLVKKGSVQIQRLAKQDELNKNSNNDVTQIKDDFESLKIKTSKKVNEVRQQVVIAMISEGQFFGLEDISFKKQQKSEENCQVEKKTKRTCSALTLSSCLIYAIPKSLFLNSSYQFYELQQKFIEQSKAKQIFYQKQTQKNNSIKHYLEKEINKLNSQPQMEKTLIQMSMNHHQQMLIDSNKISNMMGSYIKGNKNVLKHQKEILQMSYARTNSSQQNDSQVEQNNQQKNESSELKKTKQLIIKPTTATNQIQQYGRIKDIPDRNPADIIYALMVQAENEKALNIQENTILSVMPQSQENVKQILRAQKFYSKSKDSHNKNIRNPSRQNNNDTIFVSYSSNNLNQTNTNFNDQPCFNQGQKYVNSAISLSEFDDITTNSHFRLEKKDNMIQVKKMKQNHSMTSTHFNSPNFDINLKKNISQNELNNLESEEDQTQTFKNNKLLQLHTLTTMKNTALDKKQSYPLNIKNKSISSQNNTFYGSSNLKNDSKIQKFIQLRKESDNISLTQNESFTVKSETIGSTQNICDNNNTYHIAQNKSNTQDQQQELQQSKQQITMKNPTFANDINQNNTNNIQNNDKKHFNIHFSQFKQQQSYFGLEKPQDINQNQKSNHFKNETELQQVPSNIQKKSSSIDFSEKYDLNKCQSPLQDPEKVINFSLVNFPPQFQPSHQFSSSQYVQRPKIHSFFTNNSPPKSTKMHHRNNSQDGIYKQNRSSLQLYANFDCSEKNQLINQQNSSKSIFQTNNNSLRIGHNDYKINQNEFQQNLLSTQQRFSPKKSLSKGKLRPILPVITPQHFDLQEYSQDSNPFQSRKLLPSFNKSFTPSAS